MAARSAVGVLPGDLPSAPDFLRPRLPGCQAVPPTCLRHWLCRSAGEMARTRTRAALLLAAAVALLAACADAQHAFCDNLAEYPRGRPEAPNWTNAVDQLRAEVQAADQPGQVRRVSACALQPGRGRPLTALLAHSSGRERGCAQPHGASCSHKLTLCATPLHHPHQPLSQPSPSCSPIASALLPRQPPSSVLICNVPLDRGSNLSRRNKLA